jgi:hypothetical protein
MTRLTDTELLSIQGGWSWSDFIDGASVGVGAATLTFATLGGALPVEAAILGFVALGIAVTNLYL